MGQNWVKNVAANGTFYKPSELPIVWASGGNYYHGIPSGWTVVNI